MLRQADVCDNIGLFELSATKEKVIGFVDQGFYINVTYPSVYEKQGRGNGDGPPFPAF